MKAVVFKAPDEPAVDELPDPRIGRPPEAVICITTANIRGSGLHSYGGRADPAGMVPGHEDMGIVEEVCSAVDRIKAGDRVSVPFNLACGTCRNGYTSACLRANPSGQPGAGTATRRRDRTGADRRNS